MTSTLLTCTSSTRPGSPNAGDTLFETDTNKIIVYSGSAWKVYDSDASTYALDGSNILTQSPIFHFDAGKINGTDATGNPSDGSAFSGVWTSKVNGIKTFAQGTASKQPTWNTSGTSSEAYIESDGGDGLDIDFRSSLNIPNSGAFTLFGVAKRNGSGHIVLGGKSKANFELYPATSSQGIWMGYSSGSDYLMYNQTGSVNGAHPTFASGSGNGSTAVSTYDVTRLFMVVRDSSNNTRLFVDGNNTNSSNVATASTEVLVERLLDNNGYRTTGQTYEVGYFNGDLSTADKNTLISYVNSRYGTGRNADNTDDLARATF